MTKRVDLFDTTYGHFKARVLAEIRKDTFGVDIGQNSWTTAEEYDRFADWLELSAASHVLEIASGSGGPAIHLARLTGARVTGLDANEHGVATSNDAAAGSDQAGRVAFRLGDATQPLPFDDASFDALMCIDSMNHFPNRLDVFREWRRVLRPGGRALFTDPVAITGLVTNDELALRSSIGLFVFAPVGLNERLIEQAGLRTLRVEDLSDNGALVSGRWQQSRERHRQDLLKIEGEEQFEGLQRFFGAVCSLTSERRLSRIGYLVERPR